MPISVQTPPGSANNELIPVTGDTNWGPYTTSWMLAANNNLGFPKTGGLYYLTGDVNFGNTNGFILKYLISEAAATPSTSGVLRLGSADSIGWRNNANSANLLLGINGSDQLTFNGVPIASSATNGMLAQISPGVVVGRTITGTTLQIDLVNGDGIAGDPVVSIDPGYVGQTSITTLGTITTGTWNATTVAIAHGGTSATTANTAFNNLAPTQTSNANKYLQTDGTNTSWQQAVRSVSLNDASSTPIYTTSPTTGATDVVAETITLKTQTHNTVFAGPTFTPGTAAQPTFRHLESYDLEGAAPGSATDVIYNGTVGGVPNSFAADGGFTYDSTILGATTVVIGPGGVVGSGNLSTVILNAPTATFQGQSFSVGTQAGGALAVNGGGTSYNLAAGGNLTLDGGNGGGGGANQASMFLQGGQALGGAGYIQVIGGESFSSTSNPTPLAGNVTIQGGNNQQYATPTNALGGSVIIEGGQRFTSGSAPIVDQYNGSILFMTSGTNRFRIQPLGDWQIGSTLSSGLQGQVIVSQGTGNPPVWTNLNSTSIYTVSSSFATVGSGGTNLGSVTLNPTGGSSTFFDGQTILISVHGTCTGDSTHLVEFTAQVNSSNIITFSLPVTGAGTTIPYKTNIYLIFNASGTLFKSWIETTTQATGILGTATGYVSAISNSISVGSLTGPITVGVNGAINAAGVTCVADAITVRSI